MGLDMYLTKKTYIGNQYRDEKDRLTLNDPLGRPIQTERITYIEEEVGYWRKANAIHSWFVENCQGGVDECQDTYVPMEKLKELRDLCKKVLASVKTEKGKVSNGYSFTTEGGRKDHFYDGKVVTNPEVCELLPTQSGFFFGGTDYDEGYIADLKDTIKILDALDSAGDYYYHSSW